VNRKFFYNKIFIFPLPLYIICKHECDYNTSSVKEKFFNDFDLLNNPVSMEYSGARGKMIHEKPEVENFVSYPL
jgi:hypothetical protein